MNRITAFTALFIVILCAFTCREKYQENKIEKITLHYVDLQIETPFRIPCESFEDLFSSSYKTIVINDNDQLKEFSNYLSHSETSDSIKKIDVRVKLLIKYNNKKTSVLCMDKFSNLIFDNKLIKNERLAAFIKARISH